MSLHAVTPVLAQLLSHPLADDVLRGLAAMLAPMDLTPAREHPPPTAIMQTITVDTDLSTLTPQQINELTINVLNEAASSRPLISELAPISVLREEYTATSFTSQIDTLQAKGFIGIMRTRGDGDCFYRSLAYAYVENILNAQDREFAATLALSQLQACQQLLDAAGFQKMVYEDFAEVLVNMIENISRGDDERIINPDILLQAFQDAEVSNSCVVFLRMLASAQIRMDPETYDPFLVHPELNVAMNSQDFCVQFVESVGKEADHVQVAALSKALNINVQIAYLDGRNPDGHVDFVPFTNKDDDHETMKDLILLYRPGHYDVLETKESHISPR